MQNTYYKKKLQNLHVKLIIRNESSESIDTVSADSSVASMSKDFKSDILHFIDKLQMRQKKYNDAIEHELNVLRWKLKKME